MIEQNVHLSVSSPMLSILICHAPWQRDRVKLFNRLHANLITQIAGVEGHVEILINDESKLFIGQKRNKLLQQANGQYVAFVDDDDNVSVDYIYLLLNGISRGVDCCSLRGILTDDGRNPRIFEHSVRHGQYATVDPATHKGVSYLRYPNHLNCIKASIAKQFTFAEINHGEDTDWATQIFNSGLIKTEYWIDDVIYYYEYRSNK